MSPEGKHFVNDPRSFHCSVARLRRQPNTPVGPAAVEVGRPPSAQDALGPKSKELLQRDEDGGQDDQSEDDLPRTVSAPTSWPAWPVRLPGPKTCTVCAPLVWLRRVPCWNRSTSDPAKTRSAAASSQDLPFRTWSLGCLDASDRTDAQRTRSALLRADGPEGRGPCAQLGTRSKTRISRGQATPTPRW